MRRQAFFGELGRRLAESVNDDRSCTCVLSATSSTPRALSRVASCEGGSSERAVARCGMVGGGLPPRPEGAR